MVYSRVTTDNVWPKNILPTNNNISAYSAICGIQSDCGNWEQDRTLFSGEVLIENIEIGEASPEGEPKKVQKLVVVGVGEVKYFEMWIMQYILSEESDSWIRTLRPNFYEWGVQFPPHVVILYPQVSNVVTNSIKSHQKKS